jgi:hypothetical protein
MAEASPLGKTQYSTYVLMVCFTKREDYAIKTYVEYCVLPRGEVEAIKTYVEYCVLPREEA